MLYVEPKASKSSVKQQKKNKANTLFIFLCHFTVNFENWFSLIIFPNWDAYSNLKVGVTHLILMISNASLNFIHHRLVLNFLCIESVILIKDKFLTFFFIYINDKCFLRWQHSSSIFVNLSYQECICSFVYCLQQLFSQDFFWLVLWQFKRSRAITTKLSEERISQNLLPSVSYR